MLNSRFKTFAALCLIVVAAISPAMAQDEKPSVQPLIDRMVASYLNLDAEGLEELWARDGRLVFAGGELNGSKVIGERYQMVFDHMGEGLHLKMEVIEEWADGDAIMAWGVFAQMDGDEAVDDGRFVMRVVRKGKKWKLSRVWVLHAG